jgi:diacylglycerol kinase (ATP)
MDKENFFKNRVRSVGVALRGALLLVRTEGSIKVQAIIRLMVTGAGIYFDLTATEWMLQVFAIGLVLGVEGVNTAIEKLSDYVQPQFDSKIGFIKDISAGAVLCVSVAASIIGLIIYIPKIF